MNTFILVIVIALIAGLWMLRRKFFGGLTMEALKSLKARGALLVDVRTPGEFNQAHAPGTKNIPLDQLGARLGELDKTKPVILCCASGGRSGMAKQMLQREGFQDVHNAGPWQTLQGL